MARPILIAVLLTFLSVQLVSCQDPSQACTNATLALQTATQCQQDGDDIDRSVVCNGECRSLTEAVLDACADDDDAVSILLVAIKSPLLSYLPTFYGYIYRTARHSK